MEHRETCWTPSLELQALDGELVASGHGARTIGGTEISTEISISEIPWKFLEISEGQNPFPWW